MFTDLEEIINGLIGHFDQFKIDFFIVGAKARDILAKNVGLKESPRKTADVDFAILVDSWDTLEKLRQSFALDVNIEESPNKNNKVRYKFKGTPFDIVPFGKNIEKDGKVSFPPFYETLLTVVGYSEAMGTAKKINVGKREIKVTTAEMLVGLKLVSWDENKARDRDAKDINYIFSNYTEIDADAELDIYDNFPELVEEFDGDMRFASITLMGIRLSKFTDGSHKNLMIAILNDIEKRDRLSRSMNDSATHNLDENIALSLKQLNALLSGLRK
jgi:predicted nucleotidyltransferase